jgi:hypothetical protein
LLNPILANSGYFYKPNAPRQDISHWFDKSTRDLKTQVDTHHLMKVNPVTGTKAYYTPAGRFIDIPPQVPRSDYKMVREPWWLDQSRCLGNLTRKVRKIKIVNMLTKQELVLEVVLGFMFR